MCTALVHLGETKMKEKQPKVDHSIINMVIVALKELYSSKKNSPADCRQCAKHCSKVELRQDKSNREQQFIYEPTIKVWSFHLKTYILESQNILHSLVILY